MPEEEKETEWSRGVAELMIGRTILVVATYCQSAFSMSVFSEANNYEDLVECCHIVLDRCHEVDQAIAQLPIQDARRLAISDLQNHVAGLLFSLKALTKGRTRAQIDSLFGGLGVSVDRGRDNTHDFWRFGLTAITHFRIDALFQVILRARGEYKTKSAFTTMLKQILDLSEMKDRSRSEAIFLVATYVRNSFHNNGVHRGPSLYIELQDMKFQFETDKSTNCASFGHVLAVLYEIMGCLKEILISPAIAHIKGPILDDWLLEMSP